MKVGKRLEIGFVKIQHKYSINLLSPGGVMFRIKGFDFFDVQLLSLKMIKSKYATNLQFTYTVVTQI